MNLLWLATAKPGEAPLLVSHEGHGMVPPSGHAEVDGLEVRARVQLDRFRDWDAPT